MVILNTTFHLHDSVRDDALQWIRRAYAASAHKAGATAPATLTRVLGAEGEGFSSYALHLTFPDLPSAKAWNEGVGQSLRNIMGARWSENALSFQTYLEVMP